MKTFPWLFRFSFISHPSVCCSPDQRQDSVRGLGWRGRHHNQRLPQQHQLPQHLDVEEDGVEAPAQRGGGTTGGVRRQSGRVSLQYRKADSRWRHMRGGGRDRAWISPEEVDFVDGRQHDGHLTVALEQTESRLSSTNYLFIYFHPKYVTSVCVTSVCLYLRGLDQLWSSRFVVRRRDANLHKKVYQIFYKNICKT